MKKRLAVVLAALMMLSTSTVFMAAESNATDVKVNYITQDGVAVEFTVAETTEAVVTEAEAEVATKVTTDEATSAEILAAVDISLPAGMVSMPTGGLDLTIDVAGVKAGDNIVVLHKAATGWELIAPVSVADGKVVAHFNSLSPVVIVKVTEEAPAADNSIYYWLASPFGAATTATLPKTGAVAVLPVAALACLAGAVVCGRKEK